MKATKVNQAKKKEAKEAKEAKVVLNGGLSLVRKFIKKPIVLLY